MTSQESIDVCEVKSKKHRMLSKPYAYLNKLAKNLKFSKSTTKGEADLLTGKVSSETDLQVPKQLDSQATASKKKSLVLDLDKTLLITSMEVTKYPSYPVKVMYMGEECIFYVARRPGVYSFVEELSKYYEITIFTTSLPEYAAAMIEFLCIDGFIKTLFHRDHCGRINGTTLFKNLRKVGNTLDNVIFIDDSPIQVSHFRSNSIHILPFEGDCHDQELYKLSSFLKEAASLSDIRPVEEKLKVFNAGGNMAEVMNAKPEASNEPLVFNTDPDVKQARVARNFTIPKPREMKFLSHVDIKEVKTIDVTLTPLSGVSGLTASTSSGSKIGSNFYYTKKVKKVSICGFEETEIAELDELTQIIKIPALETNTSSTNKMMI